ncbi:hypothetical protein GE061_017678 [Apolygus lucorum]|uniref:Uncharacterized protein n=1 Tax=Apolygus lucorum TaxID=248454 RepID=A0A8S9XFP4_APOLU|nr:hypothetical protein GE061_017678 [Apolygus lucorum]
MMNSSFNTINKTLPKVTKQEAVTGGSTSLTELDEMGQEDLKYLKCMKETLTAMLAATKKQPNISQIVKDGLNTMEEMCDALVTQEKRRTSVQKRLKAEVDKLTKWSPSKERSHGSRKRRKEDETDLSNSEEDCMETETSSHVVSDSDTAGVPFEKVKSRKGRQDLAKEAQRKAAREARRDADRIRRIKQQAEVEAQKKEAEKKRKESEEKRRAEQDGRRKRKEAVKRDVQRNLKRSQALVIKVSDQISYAEVLQKLKDKVNPAEMNTEIRKIRRTGGGDVLLEVEPTSTISDAFKKAVENAVGEGLVKDLKPRASIEIRDLDPLTTAEEVDSSFVGLGTVFSFDFHNLVEMMLVSTQIIYIPLLITMLASAMGVNVIKTHMMKLMLLFAYSCFVVSFSLYAVKETVVDQIRYDPEYKYHDLSTLYFHDDLHNFCLVAIVGIILFDFVLLVQFVIGSQRLKVTGIKCIRRACVVLVFFISFNTIGRSVRRIVVPGGTDFYDILRFRLAGLQSAESGSLVDKPASSFVVNFCRIFAHLMAAVIFKTATAMIIITYCSGWGSDSNWLQKMMKKRDEEIKSAKGKSRSRTPPTQGLKNLRYYETIKDKRRSDRLQSKVSFLMWKG